MDYGIADITALRIGGCYRRLMISDGSSRDGRAMALIAIIATVSRISISTYMARIAVMYNHFVIIKD
jgi:hypothetical protein